MMTEQKFEVLAMRSAGYTVAAIAKKFGVTKESIYPVLYIRNRRLMPSKLARKCVYPQVGAAIERMRLSTKEIYEGILGHKTTYPSQPMMYIGPRLEGKTSFTAEEWRKMSKAFGVSLDQLMEVE